MKRSNYSLLSRLLLAGVIVAMSTSPALADGPAETPRYFAQLVISDETSVDWESEDSKRVVARDGDGFDAIDFLTPVPGVYFEEDVVVRDDSGNVIIDLRGTRWIRLPALHIKKSGVEQITHIYWLQEDLDGDGEPDPASPGMTAATGPEGIVFNIVTIEIARVPSSDSYHPNKFHIAAPGAGTFKLCIAAGLFQK